MKIFASTIILFFSSVLIFSQNSDSTISVSAGKQYKAGWFYNVFFGKHWRDVWTTSVETKILNLNTFVNGLTPHKKGGGFQTKSLRFKGNDNQYWKFHFVKLSSKFLLCTTSITPYPLKGCGFFWEFEKT